MVDRFPVPDAYRRLEQFPQKLAWCDALPAKAEALAGRWRLEPDGEEAFGWNSVVWPVRQGDRPLVLKIHDFSGGTDGERLALAVARGPGLVQLVDAEPAQNALLLQRLDATRTLEGVEGDEATEVIGDRLAEITAHEAPEGIRPLAGELDRIHASITAMLDRTPRVLPRAAADRALETCGDLAVDLRADPAQPRLVHGDLHYANVLHTLPGEDSRWVAIDPLPFAGYPEADVVAALRNRWVEAGGDTGARRRLDILVERAGLDQERAVRITQAVAVSNALWLADQDNLHPDLRAHLVAYRAMALW